MLTSRQLPGNLDVSAVVRDIHLLVEQIGFPRIVVQYVPVPRNQAASRRAGVQTDLICPEQPYDSHPEKVTRCRCPLGPSRVRILEITGDHRPLPRLNKETRVIGLSE